ncbi:MAG: hypothetical protein HPY62_03470 [Bacteroidales bacterium]|nr:hypothetical protein [Bacteroidales bacterium]
MRNFILSAVLILGISGNVISQEEKFSVKCGAGYYADVMAWYDGPVIWLEGGYKFRTGFFLNARLSVASIDWKMNSEIFGGYNTIALRQMADLTFSRPVRLAGNHFIEPGTGFKLKREYHLFPELEFIEDSGELYILTKYSDIFYEIGFDLYLDYYYQFPGGFCLGLRADTNVIWALGFEGLTISPVLAFKF